MKKKEVKFFISYARSNDALAKRFIEKFKEQASPSKSYKYTYWKDTDDILVGENWLKAITRATDSCNAGLLLVSPAFLASQFITEVELPNLINKRNKVVIPIMLQPLDFDRYDLKGLNKTQIYAIKTERMHAPRAYGDCSPNLRNRFVQELYAKVENALDEKLR